MARPLKHDYAEVDRLLAEGMTAYQVAKQLQMSIPTVYNHSRTLDLGATPEILEKLGNPSPISFPWGTVYVLEGTPGKLYKFVATLTEKTALASIGELEICKIGLNAEPLMYIVANKVKFSREMDVALGNCKITILLKGEM